MKNHRGLAHLILASWRSDSLFQQALVQKALAREMRLSFFSLALAIAYQLSASCAGLCQRPTPMSGSTTTLGSVFRHPPARAHRTHRVRPSRYGICSPPKSMTGFRLPRHKFIVGREAVSIARAWPRAFWHLAWTDMRCSGHQGRAGLPRGLIG